MTLPERVAEALEFDEQKIMDGFDVTRQARIRYKAALAEHARTKTLTSFMPLMCEQLKRECCCPGERHDGKEILCDPCELLARIEQALE